MKKVNVKKTNDPRYKQSPYLVRWREDTGKQPQRAFPTKTLAEQFADQVRLRLNASLFGQVIQIEWTELTKEYLDTRIANRTKQTTLDGYHDAFKQFCGTIDVPLSDKITVRHINVFKQSLLGNSPATVNKKLRYLSALFTWAKDQQYISINPVTKSGKLKEQRKLPKSITPDQFKKIVAVAPAGWKELIHLAVNGVARKNSLLQLTKSDIDLVAGTIKTWDEKQNREVLAPIHPVTVELLRKYLPTLSGKNLFTGAYHHSVWQRLVRQAGTPYIQFHHLRTCMSSWMKSAGVSSDVVSRIFGHSSPTVTYNHYTALDIDDRRLAINQLPLGESEK